MEYGIATKVIQSLNVDYDCLDVKFKSHLENVTFYIKKGLRLIESIELNSRLSISDLKEGRNSVPMYNNDIDSLIETEVHPSEVIKSLTLIPDIKKSLFSITDSFLARRTYLKTRLLNELKLSKNIDEFTMKSSFCFLDELIKYTSKWQKEELIDMYKFSPFISKYNFCLFQYLVEHYKNDSKPSKSRFTEFFYMFTSKDEDEIEIKEKFGRTVFLNFALEYMQLIIPNFSMSTNSLQNDATYNRSRLLALKEEFDASQSEI